MFVVWCYINKYFVSPYKMIGILCIHSRLLCEVDGDIGRLSFVNWPMVKHLSWIPDSEVYC